MNDIDPPPPESIWAAGCVVTRRKKNGKPEYLLIYREKYRDWTLPKGKVDKGETFLQAAERETVEETGFTGKNPRPIGTVGYKTRAGNPKVVWWWLIDAKKGKFKPNSEVDEISWLTRKKAIKKLSYRNDREVLDRAHDVNLAKSAGMIYLVRHASAGKRRDADVDDWQRPLDKQGRKQRRAISDLLMAHPLTRIGSSRYTRCMETVNRLAKINGMPVEVEPALSEGSHPHRVVSLIAGLQGESAVLCTHGDIIEDFVGHLFAEQVPMDGPMEWKKGSIWELRTVAGRVVSGRYVPPPT
ncbi:MAG: NUDIX hydrolase [Actinomycetota bacterium]